MRHYFSPVLFVLVLTLSACEPIGGHKHQDPATLMVKHLKLHEQHDQVKARQQDLIDRIITLLEKITKERR